jgi:hypothetical protein
MYEPDVLVIGGGPAGVAAATELAMLGLTVLLAEQRDRLGGAIHRAYAGPGKNPLKVLSRHSNNWKFLTQRLLQAGPQITTLFETIYLGVDGEGRFLLDQRAAGRVVSVRPKALVLALGALEIVLPRPGWELPGVTTVGGMQVQLKETGQAPVGSILLAGNGPLPLALAAQLTAAGNPPVAVLERSQPFRAAFRHAVSAVNSLRSWGNVSEAAGYTLRLWRAGVPYQTGSTVTAIEAGPQGLRVTSQLANGVSRQHQVRHLALHDGLASNNRGLPAGDLAHVYVVRAGDCREVLGAGGALTDGRHAAHQVAQHLDLSAKPASFESRLGAARRTQQALAVLGQAPAMVPVSETVICRCEGLRRADFEALQGASSTREVRLVGRFGMGLCQGRFCARAVQAMAAQAPLPFETGDLGSSQPRWPLRPVSVASLAAYKSI